MDIKDQITIKEASSWASEYLGKHISVSNISYLIQYGRIKKITERGTTFVSKAELNRYLKCHPYGSISLMGSRV